MRNERKPIPGFERYEADESGQIWMVAGLKKAFVPHTLRPVVGAHGYLTVRVYVGPRGITRTVHSLVARAFYGERPDAGEARHLNGDKRDNRSANLRWGTSRENTADQIRAGRLQIPATRRGVTHKLAKLNESNVRDLRNLHLIGWSYVALSRRFGISTTRCRLVVKRKAWSHVD